MDKASKTYLFLKRSAAGWVDTPFRKQVYREWIEEKTDNFPTFPEELRSVALEAIVMEDTSWVRRGLSALEVVGKKEDIQTIVPLLDHTDPDVAKDTRSCLFELEHRPSCRSNND